MTGNRKCGFSVNLKFPIGRMTENKLKNFNELETKRTDCNKVELSDI